MTEQVTEQAAVQATAYEFTADLTILMDFKHPNAYLAMPAIAALLDDFSPHVDWLPLLVTPNLKNPSTIEGDDRSARHRRYRAAYQERELYRYAELLNLELTDIYREVDSSVACAGMLWMKERQPKHLMQFVVCVFRRYWQGQLDLESADEIAVILDELDANGAGFIDTKKTLNSDLIALQDQLRAAAMFNVPGFVLTHNGADPELFIGRQHMPMLRWRLSGKAGAPPI